MDIWQHLMLAMGLFLVIEGLLPFASPAQWRRLVMQVAQSDDRTIRLTGLTSMLLGLAVLYLINH
ncbi:hypothetical protein GCM10011297_19010 [Bacterioplanes sanyensis]|jgi:uncharacterized protein YjeT (DUF2065 family)|uniref:DUF2065 domain-containing protein n=1 Tax=Bacterioplanes sanyensis TaxID=1249553 RepID=UPI00167B422F|nr:DUF2065 domain-containing protein [Bacterioplanes sanyensis]GGY46365.1 hypothetical protein GCM10011297_19010 [Bacterioplanes sanyensis]